MLAGQSCSSWRLRRRRRRCSSRRFSEARTRSAVVARRRNRYIALNTTIPPFDNVNVRKAVSAAIDRDALRPTRGGAVVGDIATHFLPPGVPGFEEAGGKKGTGRRLPREPERRHERSRPEYMKKAGYPTGKYNGARRS